MRRGEEAGSFLASSPRNGVFTGMKVFALTPSLARLPSPSGTQSGFFTRGAGGEGNFQQTRCQAPYPSPAFSSSDSASAGEMLRVLASLATIVALPVSCHSRARLCNRVVFRNSMQTKLQPTVQEEFSVIRLASDLSVSNTGATTPLRLTGFALNKGQQKTTW